MFKRPAFPFALGVAGLLVGCVPLPTNDSVAPATESEFAPVAPAPAADFFADDATVQDVATPTKFKPDLKFTIGSLQHGQTPAVTISIYQTKGELEVKETHTLIEKASFRFDQLSPGQEVGTGSMELGTPPKMTLGVSVKVTSTDQTSTAVLSVKASNVLASVYVADMRIKQVAGGLIITTLGNATRANDKNGIHNTEVSARITQTLNEGLVVLPQDVGPMRVRTLIVSEPDTTNQVTGQKVYRDTYTIE
jgi:hypothetical protein